MEISTMWSMIGVLTDRALGSMDLDAEADRGVCARGACCQSTTRAASCSKCSP